MKFLDRLTGGQLSELPNPIAMCFRLDNLPKFGYLRPMPPNSL